MKKVIFAICCVIASYSDVFSTRFGVAEYLKECREAGEYPSNKYLLRDIIAQDAAMERMHPTSETNSYNHLINNLAGVLKAIDEELSAKFGLPWFAEDWFEQARKLIEEATNLIHKYRL